MLDKDGCGQVELDTKSTTESELEGQKQVWGSGDAQRKAPACSCSVNRGLGCLEEVQALLHLKSAPGDCSPPSLKL